MVILITSLLFLIFGWIFAVKGLVIAALCISAFSTFLLFLGMIFKSLQEKVKGSRLSYNLSYLSYLIILILSIVKLCVGF